MTTDLLLDDNDGDWITLDAAVVRTSASDVMIDNPDRRTPDSSPYRRALVHDETDGLTVNFSDDYPGGLSLSGVVRIVPKEVVKGETPDLTLPPKKIPWDLWQGIGGMLKVPTETVHADFTPGPELQVATIPTLKIQGGVEFYWSRGGVPLLDGDAPGSVNLQNILEDLRTQIAFLEARIEALGG